MEKHICKDCDYYMAGDPPACNALHTPGVDSCADYEKKSQPLLNNEFGGSSAYARMVESSRNYYQHGRDRITNIMNKLDEYRCRYRYRPEKIILHPEAITEIFHSYHIHCFYEVVGELGQRQMSIFGMEVIRSLDVPLDYIGFVAPLSS